MLDKDGNRMGIEDVKREACGAQSIEEINEMADRIHSEDPIVARNAAWVMTHFTKEQVEMLMPRQDEMVDVILETDNSSLRRLLLNVVERQEMNVERLRTDFLDFCLEHLVSPDEQPGIQSLCMKLAYRQCCFFPELMEEMKNTLGMMEEGYAKSVMGLRRKYLKKLG